jgi:hypothetical protein
MSSPSPTTSVKINVVFDYELLLLFIFSLFLSVVD